MLGSKTALIVLVSGLGLALLLGVVFADSSDRGIAGGQNSASTMQTAPASSAESGLKGRTIVIVGSGAEGGTPSRQTGSMAFAVVPIEGASAAFDAAKYVTSGADGSFNVALPSGQYRIVSIDEARNPNEFQHRRRRMPLTLRTQTVVVHEGKFTDVEVVFVGEAP